jgi:hypothetical protein
MKPVDICFKSMQGLTTVLSEQYVMLRNLVRNLKLLLEAERPMPTEDVTNQFADVQCVTRRSYLATRVSIRNFFANLGHFALIRWRDLPNNDKRELEDGIGLLFLSAIERTSITAAERDSSDSVTSDKLPLVIPRDLAKVSSRNFHEVVLQQSVPASQPHRESRPMHLGEGRVPRLQVCCSRNVLRPDTGETVLPRPLKGRVGAIWTRSAAQTNES